MKVVTLETLPSTFDIVMEFFMLNPFGTHEWKPRLSVDVVRKLSKQRETESHRGPAGSADGCIKDIWITRNQSTCQRHSGVCCIFIQIWSRFHSYQKGSKGPPRIKIGSCKSCREKYSVSPWPFSLVLHSHFDFCADHSLQTSTSAVKTRIAQHWLRWIPAKDCSLPLFLF